MEDETGNDYFLDIIQTLALIHGDLVAIKEILEGNNKPVQKTLASYKKG